MKCKFCDTLMDENTTVCPACGKEQEEIVKEETAPVEEPVSEEIADSEEIVEAIEDAEELVYIPVEKKKSATPLVLSIIAAVAALGSLLILLLMAFGFSFVGVWTAVKGYLNIGPNDIQFKESYVVAEEKAQDKADDVIAKIGDKELTNAQLQIYYRMQVMDLLSYYNGYESTIGLDTTKPFGEQPCYFDENMSWEQYLLKISIETWQNYQIIGLLAEEAGFTLDAEWEESLAQLPENLLQQATASGFETVDELLADVIGPACTQEEYMEYVRLAYLSNAYYNTMNEENIPTPDEVAAYYEENKATFEQQGITADLGNVANVRHILVAPSGGVKNAETGLTEYSEDDWKACLKAAEKILKEWKAGEATEASFGELATKYTADGGSASTGGLYEGVAPGSNYVENFLNWSIDPARQVGETGIVQTEFGYHIMYYVSGEPYWTEAAKTQLMADRITKMTEEAEEKWPMDVDYKKIAISQLNLG